MPHFKFTQHFLLRQWERSIHSFEMEKILAKLKDKIKEMGSNKTHVVIGERFLKSLKLKKGIFKNLIIVVKAGKLLVTMFFVVDLLAYLKSAKDKESVLLI